MNAPEEPSYMMFARANARDGVATTATVVRELVARIDRDAATLAKAKPTNEQTAAVKAVERITATMDAFYRSGSPENQFKALSEISAALGAYNMERI